MELIRLKGESKMLDFLIGLIIGANFSLFLYACILVGTKSENKEVVKTCQKKDTTG